MARVTYQPNSQLTFTSRFRFDEGDFTLQRSEFEAAAATSTAGRPRVMYGNYAPQPAIGFLDGREGITATARFKLTAELADSSAGSATICRPSQLNQTQIGIGYVDDCLILALNYITEYAYNGSVTRQPYRDDADQLADARRDIDQTVRHPPAAPAPSRNTR